ncbi:MAG: hypothetical protein ACT4PL_02600 [Phycisphaerales bacterium]
MNGSGYFYDAGSGACGLVHVRASGSYSGYLTVPNQGTQWAASHNAWH